MVNRTTILTPQTGSTQIAPPAITTIRISMLPLTITVMNRPVHTCTPKATTATIMSTRIGTSTTTPIQTASPTRIRTATSIGMPMNMNTETETKTTHPARMQYAY